MSDDSALKEIDQHDKVQDDIQGAWRTAATSEFFAWSITPEGVPWGKVITTDLSDLAASASGIRPSKAVRKNLILCQRKTNGVEDGRFVVIAVRVEE